VSDPNGFQPGNREQLPGEADHEIEWLRYRFADGAYGAEVQETRCHQHRCTGFLIGLRVPNRIVEIRFPAQKIIALSRKFEIKAERSRCLNTGLNPFEGCIEEIDRLIFVFGRAFEREPDDAGLSRPAHGFCNSLRSVA